MTRGGDIQFRVFLGLKFWWKGIFFWSMKDHHPVLIQVYPCKWGWPDLLYPILIPISISLNSRHPPSPNQHSCSPSPLESSMSSFIGNPHFLLPFPSNSNIFFKTYPSSLLNTCPYHLTPFLHSVLFFSISFAPHIVLTIALLVLLKNAILFSLKHHVSLPYNITDLTQLR